MTLNAVQQTLPNPFSSKVDAPQGTYIFHGYSTTKGWAQLTKNDQRYWGVGNVQECDEDHRPLADQQAYVVVASRMIA